MIYASAATVDFSAEDLHALLEVARKNNKALDVTGMLIYHNGSFLQVLEGEKDVVETLFKHIDKDSRHSNVRILLRGEIDERHFAEWQMGFYDTSTSAVASHSGFFDFFRSDAVLDDADRARQVLQQFRNGAWRQQVET